MWSTRFAGRSLISFSAFLHCVRVCFSAPRHFRKLLRASDVNHSMAFLAQSNQHKIHRRFRVLMTRRRGTVAGARRHELETVPLRCPLSK